MTAAHSPEPPWGDRITPLTEVADGRYVLLHELAQGERSIVYRAKPSGSTVSIAFKLIQPSFVGDEAQVRRFLREAELLRRIEHPNIVRLVDQGQIEDGRDFIALELLVGRTLAEALENGERIDPERTCAIARQVALGLAAMHRAGVVHRDLQPENILLVGSDDRPRVKLVDLSDAGDVGAPARRVRARRRRDSGRVLADGYRAPEQLKKRPPHAGMDVFALGVIMFEMLAGEHPFVAAPTRPTRMGSSTIRSRVFDAPEVLLALVADCIELDPKLRPGSVDVVIERLDEALLWMGVTPQAEREPDADEEAATRAYPSAGDVPQLPEVDRVEQRRGVVKGSFDAPTVPGGAVDDAAFEPEELLMPEPDAPRSSDSIPRVERPRPEPSEELDEPEPDAPWSSESIPRVERPRPEPSEELDEPEPDAPRSSESIPRVERPSEDEGPASDDDETPSVDGGRRPGAVVDTVAWTKPERSASPAGSKRRSRSRPPGHDPGRRPSPPPGPPAWVVPLAGAVLIALAWAVWVVWSQ